jgi:hypothetical protein
VYGRISKPEVDAATLKVEVMRQGGTAYANLCNSIGAFSTCMDKGFDKMNERLDILDGGLDKFGDKIDYRFGKLGDKIDSLGDKIDYLGDKIDYRFGKLGDKIDYLGDKIDYRFGKLGDKIDYLSDKIDCNLNTNSMFFKVSNLLRICYICLTV